MENECKNAKQDCAKKENSESWLGSLNYRHKMFSNKLFEACYRLDLITRELGGEYTEKEILQLEERPAIANQLSAYEILLYNNEDILADIYAITLRLETIIKI
jgi:hypothetical protein